MIAFFCGLLSPSGRRKKEPEDKIVFQPLPKLRDKLLRILKILFESIRDPIKDLARSYKIEQKNGDEDCENDRRDRRYEEKDVGFH